MVANKSKGNQLETFLQKSCGMPVSDIVKTIKQLSAPLTLLSNVIKLPFFVMANFGMARIG